MMSKVTHSSRCWTRISDYWVCGDGAGDPSGPAASTKRYFFHFRDDAGLVLDEDGMRLETLADARREALRGARWMSMAAASSVGGACGGVVEVCDEEGRLLFTLPLDQVEATARTIKARVARA